MYWIVQQTPIGEGVEDIDEEILPIPGLSKERAQKIADIINEQRGGDGTGRRWAIITVRKTRR
jgi:hypothetical protein